MICANKIKYKIEKKRMAWEEAIFSLTSTTTDFFFLWNWVGTQLDFNAYEKN